MNLLNQFDVCLSKQKGDINGFSWKATISKLSFPKMNLTNKPKLFHLNEEKYKKSFDTMLEIFGVVPKCLFEYNVLLDGELIVITASTETTLRVAIVDLITQILPNASVKMVRPPLNFRVYVPEETQKMAKTEADISNEVEVDIGGIFGEIEDY